MRAMESASIDIGASHDIKLCSCELLCASHALDASSLIYSLAQVGEALKGLGAALSAAPGSAVSTPVLDLDPQEVEPSSTEYDPSAQGSASSEMSQAQEAPTNPRAQPSLAPPAPTPALPPPPPPPSELSFTQQPPAPPAFASTSREPLPHRESPLAEKVTPVPTRVMPTSSDGAPDAAQGGQVGSQPTAREYFERGQDEANHPRPASSGDDDDGDYRDVLLKSGLVRWEEKREALRLQQAAAAASKWGSRRGHHVVAPVQERAGNSGVPAALMTDKVTRVCSVIRAVHG